MNWRTVLNTKISDGRTVFDYLFGNDIVEPDEDIMDKPLSEEALDNIKHMLRRDGLSLVEE